MDSSSPTAKMSTPRAYSTAAHSSLGLLCDDGPRPRARPVLHIFDVFDGTWVPRGSVVIAQPVHQYVPNCVHDAQKRHMSGMKGGDEFLVGGVVHRRRHPTGAAGSPGQINGGERLRIERFECPTRRLRPIDRRGRAGDAIGPASASAIGSRM